jgi:SRSO17 transposase
MDISKAFSKYVELLAPVLAHADRREPFTDYCTGLLLEGKRKSVEPMAARLEPRAVSAKHQSLHHFVSRADWSDEAMLSAVRQGVLPVLCKREPVRAWIVDDTGFPKQGRHSVGVARQYCGQLGKQDNCQVAVSVSVASTAASLPIAYQLYLPEEWAQDRVRRSKAGVPDTVGFVTKPQMAVAMIRKAVEAQVPVGVVLADAGYGNDSKFREALTKMGLTYAVGVQHSMTVWPHGYGPLPPKPSADGATGRPRTLLRRDPTQPPINLKQLALGLSARAFKTLSWREGEAGWLTSRFARVRVRSAHRDYWRSKPHPEQWLLIEWPSGETEPTKYSLNTLPATTTLKEMVEITKLRWRIERDYQDLKQEIGLGHFEGRGWRGFHHHATLSIAAYGFLMLRRANERAKKNSAVWPDLPPVPEGFRPRGAPRPHSTS